MIHVEGSPIGGENPPHEQRWGRRRHSLEEHRTGCRGPVPFPPRATRTVDLDNLARPALAGLRDADVVARGYRRLDATLATKTSAYDGYGVVLDTTTVDAVVAADRPTVAEMVVAHTALPPDGDRHSKRSWRDSVRRQQATADGGGVRIDVAVNTALSLEGLLKPIVDGLDPLLGSDPSATLEFTPNDDRVEWLRIHRQPNLPCPIVLAAGSTAT